MWLSSLRDVAIILLAVESLAIGVILFVLLVEIRNLARLLQEEIEPLLNSANETADTVRSTTTFVSQKVVSPVVRVYSLASGIRRALAVFVLRNLR
ncbi:MAG: hypothetical protein H5T64_09765 [Chloroflexi bacterium]|nr:hypothetical protein [Chloroflexota bacterium]